MISFKSLYIVCTLTALDLLSGCLAERTTASVPTSAGLASTTSKFFDVNVGNEEGALIFEPDTVIASLNDVINFHFYPVNHSIAQSSFEMPCQPLSGGVGQLPIFSGFFPVKTGGSVSLKTLVGGKNARPNNAFSAVAVDVFDDAQNDGSDLVVLLTDVQFPLPGRPGHGRQSSLSRFPEGSQTLEGYKAAAQSATTSTSPTKVFGGVVMPNVGSYNASTSISTSMGTASASSAAAKKGEGVAGRMLSTMLVLVVALTAAGKLVT